MLTVLAERKFPLNDLKVFASKRSAGETIEFKNKDYEVEELTQESFKGKSIDFALFATEAELSKKYVPLATAAGAVAIDNSSYFRMNPEIPLIVPEVNPEALDQAKDHL